MTFRLFDTASRELRELRPLQPGKVSIYHCGLTVQAAPHLGHMRKEVAFDVLRRWLAEQGLEATVIANVTDIDDKILAKSAELGMPWWALAYRFERELSRAYAALGCLPPTYEPRATGHIPEMLELIATLIDNGHAYAAPDGSGDVYFDVASWPDYGQLSRQRIEDMESAGDADPRGKRDPRDFALWKGYKEGEPATASWPSPWGRGRPGWHLECSAMAGKYLGPEFDIHGGGLDLRFPHHENELAQSRAAGRPFARNWMHNGLLTAAGEKMSKSLGNGALVSEVVKRHPPRAVRYYLAAPHYRSTIEYSEAALAEAAAALARVDAFVARSAPPQPGSPAFVSDLRGLPDTFVDAMNDDLGTPKAVAVLHESVRAGNAALTAGDDQAVMLRHAEVRGMLGVLGLNADDPAWTARESGGQSALADALVADLIGQRAEAKARKDFAAADAIRDRLDGLGVELTDGRDGTSWSVRTLPEPIAADAR